MNELEHILWWSALPLVGLIVSLVSAWKGLRARTLSDHPTCRRCGYDLFGAPPDSANCPECGADLGRKRAILIGGRRRRPILIALAVLVMVASIGGIVHLKRRATTLWADIRNRPTWWLARDLEGKDPVARDFAFKELNRRYQTGLLSPEQVERFAWGVLAMQADPALTWHYEMGEMIESARAGKKLSDAVWRKYAEQAVQLTLKNRKLVRRGEPMPIKFDEGPSRVGLGQLFTVKYKARQVTVDGIPVKERLYWEHTDQMSLSGWGSMTQSLPFKPDLLAQLKDGQHRAEAVFDVEVHDRANRSQAGPPITRFSQTKKLDFTLAPVDAETVTLLNDPATQALVEQKVKVYKVERRPGGVSVSLVVNTLPLDFAVDVVLRADGRDWPIGRATMDAGSNGGAGAFVKVDKTFNAKNVDLVLRGSPDAARTTPHMTRIWGGQLTFPNVPVDAPDAPQPTQP